MHKNNWNSILNLQFEFSFEFEIQMVYNKKSKILKLGNANFITSTNAYVWEHYKLTNASNNDKG